MAGNTSLGNRKIRVDGLEKVPPPQPRLANKGTYRVHGNRFSSNAFKLICRTISWIDGPQADQPKIQTKSFLFHHVGGIH